MFARILVPIDGSEPSEAAVRLAISIAHEQHGEVILCHVVDVAAIATLSGGMVPIDPTPVTEAERANGRALLEETALRVRRASVPVRTELVEGEVVEAVLDAARQADADTIVMGSHGRSGIARMLLGSKTEGVLRHAPVPVIVAPCSLSAHA